MIPEKALQYIQDKKLTESFSYLDVWNEEHAAAFTVAKVMQMDVLSDMKNAIENALEKGETFESFKKNLLPTLNAKGWNGNTMVYDDKEKIYKEVYIDAPRRLKTIYNTNLRSAYQKGRFEHAMESDAHPYLMYRIGASKQHRDDHASWDGLILEKTDPWWNSHMPPNGYGCKCYVVAVTEARKAKYEKDGLPVGRDGQTKTVSSTPPKTVYQTFENKRSGIIEKVPAGVHPTFNFNQGMATRDLPIFNEFMKRATRNFRPYKDGKPLSISGFPKEVEQVAKSILTSQIKKDQFQSWVDTTFKYTRGTDGDIQKHNMTAIGFIDSFVTQWLKKNAGIDIGESITVGLESIILNSKKSDRHGNDGQALSKKDADYILRCMLDGNIYFQDDKHKNLLYLLEIEKGKYLQIAIAPNFRIANSESLLKIPSVRNIQFFNEEQKNTKYDKDKNILKIK